MPPSPNQIHHSLLQFGLDSSQLNNRQLQDHILAMYDLIELKLQENMLLKKQNLDLQLQFTTIQELFQNTSHFDSKNTSELLELSPLTPPSSQQQMTFPTPLPCPIYDEEDSQINEENLHDNRSNKLQNSSWTLNGTAQKTERKANGMQSTNLQEKIEKLLCQNQHILQRLEEIQERINGPNPPKAQSNGLVKNEKSRIQYGKVVPRKQEQATSQESQRASIYKWEAINTATSRSSLNGKGRET